MKSLIERSSERVSNHGNIVRTPWFPLVPILLIAAVAQFAMAIRYFGFLTGDDVEVLAEAFRVATGFRYRAWDIRNLFVPDFIVAPFIRAGVMFGVRDTRALAVIATLPFMVAHAVSTILVHQLAWRFTRDRAASIAATLIFAFHWIPLGFGSTVYPRTIATAAVLCAAFLLFTRTTAAAAVVAGLFASLAFADRFSEGVFLIPLALVAWRRAGWLLCGFAAGAVLAVGLYDAVTWGEWFGSLLKFARLTLVESDFSSRVKHQSSFWYLLTLPRWLSPFMLPFLWAGLRSRGGETVGDRRRHALVVASFAAIPLLAFSAVAHKELRYIQGVIPWMVLLAAMGLARFGRRTAIALAAACILWHLYGLNRFAKKSMPAVMAAEELGRDASVSTVAMSQLWAYGDRLYFGDRMQVIDVGIPPVRLREGLHADAVCLYETDVSGEIEATLRTAGFERAAVFRSSKSRSVVVFRRRNHQEPAR